MPRRLAHSRSITPLLALLALLARMLVPAGFMPGTAGGMPGLVPCTGIVAAGPAAMAGMAMPHAAMADHHAPAGEHPAHDGDHACPFGAIAAAADLASLLAMPPLPLPVVLVTSAALALSRPGLGLAAPPPPKTGPPARD